MVVRNEGEALCVAVEMERRAIRVYERALLVTQDAAVQAGLRGILADEKEHLRRFSAMRAAFPLPQEEEKQLISAMAADVLFAGGVMEMKREQALDTLAGLYRYAADSEAGAVETYAAFAGKCLDPRVQETFLSIVQEESGHLSVLLDRLKNSSAP